MASTRQVSRYIRLTELIPELLQLVDESRIAFRPAVELSYLKKEEQAALLEEISYTDATPSLAQAIKMKKFSNEGKLSQEVIESIMSEEKPNQKEKIKKEYKNDIEEFCDKNYEKHEFERIMKKAGLNGMGL